MQSGRLTAVVSDCINVTRLHSCRTGMPEADVMQIFFLNRLAVAVKRSIAEKDDVAGKSHYPFEIINVAVVTDDDDVPILRFTEKVLAFPTKSKSCAGKFQTTVL